MKKTIILLLAAISIIAVLFTKCSKNDEKNYHFNYSIVKSEKFTNLPPLQSFAFGKYNNYWIMVGGRTNGFHGFPTQPTPAFPYSNANKFIYVYDAKINKLDSFNVLELPSVLQKQYTSTNMQQTQIGDNLYLCGGYTKDGSTFATDSTISRINLPMLIRKVANKENVLLENIFAFDSNPNINVCATGGELIKLQNGYFYLTVGHRYYGEYSDTLPLAVQIYRNEVTAFKLIEKTNSISVDNSSVIKISDNLPDSSTQFRRRDLVVAPSVLKDGKTVGISIFGGVFTLKNTTPFTHPIYITPDLNKPYKIDPFQQASNHYSAPHVELYSKLNNRMYTTIFGGIVDSFSDTSNASFTKKIITIQRDYKSDSTTSFYNINQLDTFIGSEATFILSDHIKKYNSYGIVNLDDIPLTRKGEDSLLIGCIYGGIISTATQSNQYPSQGQKFVPTFSSKNVYLVYISKVSENDHDNDNDEYFIKFIIIAFILLLARKCIHLIR